MIRLNSAREQYQKAMCLVLKKMSWPQMGKSCWISLSTTGSCRTRLCQIFQFERSLPQAVRILSKMDQGVRSPIASQGAVRAMSHAIYAMGFRHLLAAMRWWEDLRFQPGGSVRPPAPWAPQGSCWWWKIVAPCGAFVILRPLAKQVARPAPRSKSQVLETQQRLFLIESQPVNLRGPSRVEALVLVRQLDGAIRHQLGPSELHMPFT